jgi:hypothetical protein
MKRLRSLLALTITISSFAQADSNQVGDIYSLTDENKDTVGFIYKYKHSSRCIVKEVISASAQMSLASCSVNNNDFTITGDMIALKCTGYENSKNAQSGEDTELVFNYDGNKGVYADGSLEIKIGTKTDAIKSLMNEMNNCYREINPALDIAGYTSIDLKVFSKIFENEDDILWADIRKMNQEFEGLSNFFDGAFKFTGNEKVVNRLYRPVGFYDIFLEREEYYKWNVGNRDQDKIDYNLPYRIVVDVTNEKIKINYMEAGENLVGRTIVKDAGTMKELSFEELGIKKL